MEALELLLNRSSGVKFSEPAPTDAELEQMLRAGVRAPDHGRLRPWRFLSIRGAGRDALGRLFAEATRQANSQASPEALAREADKAMRAPLLVVVIAKLATQPNVKVPEIEQLLSAGTAAQNIMLAAHALGYAAVWKTGAHAYDAHVHAGLGLAGNERIIGFLYVGTRTDTVIARPRVDISQFHSVWP